MMMMDDELGRSFKKNKYEERRDKEIIIDATGRNLHSLGSVLQGHNKPLSVLSRRPKRFTGLPAFQRCSSLKADLLCTIKPH